MVERVALKEIDQTAQDNCKEPFFGAEQAAVIDPKFGVNLQKTVA